MENERILDFGLWDAEGIGYIRVGNERKTLKKIKASTEKIVIFETLIRNDWNISRSSRELGISRWTLRTKIKQHKILRRN